ncbi:MAG: DUF1565 domain-containing protein [Cyanobacteria bacterium J06642_2]
MNTRRVVTSRGAESQSLRKPKVWLKSLGVALLAVGVTQTALYVPVRAQDNDTAETSDIGALAEAQSILHVDAINGSDAPGNGSAATPLRTIAAAVQQATPGTVIQLAPGTYNEDSGESFPIKLKSGITLKGDESNLGESHLISGGGIFISPTMARQNVAVLGASEVEIRGITLQNQQPRGYALWLESAGTQVYNSTFAGSKHDGIFMSGASNARVEGSRFFQNGANGISVLGTSAPTIANSLFQETGYGIAVGQKAQPEIVNNRIIQNRSGVVVSADAQPILRNNIISDNTEIGLVAITNALPNLGASDDPGNNVFENNGKFDIQNATRGNLLAAGGNQIAGDDRVEGEVDLAGVLAAIDSGVVTDAPGSIAEPLPQPPVAEAADDSGVDDLDATGEGSDLVEPAGDVVATEQPSESEAEAVAEGGIDFVRPAQPEGSANEDANDTTDDTVEDLTASSSQTIEFRSDAPERKDPLLDITTLIPVGSRTQTQEPPPDLTSNASPAAGSVNTDSAESVAIAANQFRILVTPRPGDSLTQLQRLAPEAATTERDGQQLFVVGVYDSRSETQEVLDRLTEAGYVATAEVVDANAS